jgi:hypothetical protein
MDAPQPNGRRVFGGETDPPDALFAFDHRIVIETN